MLAVRTAYYIARSSLSLLPFCHVARSSPTLSLGHAEELDESRQFVVDCPGAQHSDLEVVSQKHLAHCLGVSHLWGDANARSVHMQYHQRVLFRSVEFIPLNQVRSRRALTVTANVDNNPQLSGR